MYQSSFSNPSSSDRQVLPGNQSTASISTTSTQSALSYRASPTLQSSEEISAPDEGGRRNSSQVSNYKTYSGYYAPNAPSALDSPREHELRFAGAGRFWQPVDPNSKKGFLKRKLRGHASLDQGQPHTPSIRVDDLLDTTSAQSSGYAQEGQSFGNGSLPSLRPSTAHAYTAPALGTNEWSQQSLVALPVKPLARKIADDERRRKMLLHLQREAQREEERVLNLRQEEDQKEQEEGKKEVVPQDALRLDVKISHERIDLDELVKSGLFKDIEAKDLRLADTLTTAEVDGKVELPTIQNHWANDQEPWRTRHNSDSVLPRTNLKEITNQFAELPAVTKSISTVSLSAYELPGPKFESLSMSDLGDRPNGLVDHNQHHRTTSHSSISIPTITGETDSTIPIPRLGPSGGMEGSLFAELNVLRRSSHMYRNPPSYVRDNAIHGPRSRPGSTASSNLSSNKTSSTHTSPTHPTGEFFAELSASPSVVHRPKPKPKPQNKAETYPTNIKKYNTLPSEPFPLSIRPTEPPPKESQAPVLSDYDTSLPPESERTESTTGINRIPINIEPDIDPRTGRLYVHHS